MEEVNAIAVKIPDNYSEQEVIDIIDGIANRLCYKFKFGYHDPEDMKQHFSKSKS